MVTFVYKRKFGSSQFLLFFVVSDANNIFTVQGSLTICAVGD